MEPKITNNEAALLEPDPVYVATDAVSSSRDAEMDTLLELEVWSVVYAWLETLLTAVLELDGVKAGLNPFPLNSPLPALELVAVTSSATSVLEAGDSKVTVELKISVTSSGTDSDVSRESAESKFD